MSDRDFAFPHWDPLDGPSGNCFNGITKQEYAAIHLRVPSSGAAWLDAMIRENLRDEMAKAAMQGFATDPNIHWEKDAIPAARCAYGWADAMMKAREVK